MATTPKYDCLTGRLRSLESAVLALSGGLDSALVLTAMADAGIRSLAVTGRSETTPGRDLADAEAVARAAGIPYRVIESMELQREGFVANSVDRCFHCKDALFGALSGIARAEGYAHVLDGGNMSDLGDHRPGMRAARAHGVISPLIECGFTKDDVREAARARGLGLAGKPSSPCLSSRFPYGVRITPSGLKRVALAEDAIRAMGVTDLRVRDHHGVARIEAPAAEMDALYARRAEITGALMALGFEAVCLDLEGLVSGKLNRSLKAGGK